MKKLIVLMGLPGSGKSTFVRDNGLEPYTLSTDAIRLLYSPPIMTESGKMGINQTFNKNVFGLLVNLLHHRMKNGYLTVVDACHVHKSDFKKYIDLAAEYGYEVICVDFSDIPLDVVKSRNLKREEFRQVPEHVIDRFYGYMQNQNIPESIRVVKYNDVEFLEKLYGLINDTKV